MAVGLESVEFILSALSAFQALSCITPDVDYQSLFLRAPGNLWLLCSGKEDVDIMLIVSAIQSDSVISSFFLINQTLLFALVVLCPSPNASQSIGMTLIPSLLVSWLSFGTGDNALLRLLIVLSLQSMLSYILYDIKASLYTEKEWTTATWCIYQTLPLAVLAILSIGYVSHTDITSLVTVPASACFYSIVIHFVTFHLVYNTLTSSFYKSSFPITEARVICSIMSLLITYTTSTYPFAPVPAALLTAGFIAFPVYMVYTIKHQQSSMGYLISASYIQFCYLSITILSSVEPFSWLLQFLLQTQPVSRPILFLTLLVYVSTSIILINYFSNATQQIIARKFYHLVMVPVVYIGIIDASFLIMALASVLLILMALEPIRYNQLPILGKWLYTFYAGFIDSRDKGVLVQTHMYLFLGQLLPIVCAEMLSLANVPFVILASQAGTAVICIGDTFATIGGRSFKGPTWPGTTKTYTGTLTAILTIFLFQYILCLFHYDNIHYSVLLSTSVLAGVSEAITAHVDNLILPIQQVLYLTLASSILSR